MACFAVSGRDDHAVCLAVVCSRLALIVILPNNGRDARDLERRLRLFEIADARSGIQSGSIKAMASCEVPMASR